MPFHLVTLKADDKFVGYAITYQFDPVAGIKAVHWLDLSSRNTLLEGGNEIVSQTLIGDRRFAQDFPAMKTVAVGVFSIGI